MTSNNLVKKPKLLILAVALGSILNPLNTTMITVALPSIQNEFQLSSSDISWLIASYFIISAIFLPLVGKMSDFFGGKKIFLFGIILVAISSFFAPFSSNMMFLLTMRGIQAIGTSALYPSGIGMVRKYIKKNQNRVIGTLAVFATTTAAFGPTISGLLIGFGGWPVIFYVNFPVLLLTAFLAIFYIPKDTKQHGKASYKWDIIGIILFGLFMTIWMIFLQGLEEQLNIWALILSLTVTFLFYFYEKRRSEPFINVLFLRKNLNITMVYVQYVLSTVVFFALLLSMPTYFQNVLSISSQMAGIMMLSISIFSMAVTPITTRWTERAGYRIPLLVGAIIGIVGAGLLFTMNQSTALVWIFIILAIIGISNGALNIGLQNLLYELTPVQQTGVASGLFMTARFIGNILASSVYGVIFATGMNDGNKNLLTIILVIVSFILIPGMFYITKLGHLNSGLKTHNGK